MYVCSQRTLFDLMIIYFLLLIYLQAKEKEERLLRRRINRERLEEKRKQKAAEKTKSLKSGSQNAKGMKIMKIIHQPFISFILRENNFQSKIMSVGLLSSPLKAHCFNSNVIGKWIMQIINTNVSNFSYIRDYFT